MSALKLRSMAASMYSKPYKWVRSLTTTSSIATTNPTLCFSRSPLFKSPPAHALSSSSSSSYTTKPVSSAVPVVAVAHTNLGFRGNATRCFAFSTSGSSVDREAAAASGSDMGSEHNELDNNNNDLNRHNSLPSMKNQQQQSSSSSPSSDKLLTLPTILTLGRVAAVPLLIGTFYVDNWWGTTATTSIFIAAAITDWLDGYLARKMKLGSAFGAFLDPVADKLMVATTLVLLCTKPLEVDLLGQVPWLLTVPSVAIIGREITMSAVREWAASQNTKLLEAVAVNNLGKWKTASQMTALTILLATRGGSFGGPGYVVSSGVALLYVSAGLALWSLVVYMRKIWKVLLK